jgi:succinate dehydrogenase flavin-adding protein (antitoxin of CptAB toxin-antitoxin module)
MNEFLSQKQIEEIFGEFVKENKFKLNEKKNFKDFLNFLETDVYDWIKENLRCYFREND